jgi:hypothetical protein
MDDNIVHYVKKHGFLVTLLVASVFLVLVIGEVCLYRNQMKINQMLSEGLMQIKEASKDVIR